MDVLSGIPPKTTPTRRSVPWEQTAATDPPLDTLEYVLMWMGHECSGACPDWMRSMPSAAWLLPRGGLVGSVGLVVLDARHRPEPLDQLIEGLRAVNRCVRRDHIRVLLTRHDPEHDAQGVPRS